MWVLTHRAWTELYTWYNIFTWKWKTLVILWTLTCSKQMSFFWSREVYSSWMIISETSLNCSSPSSSSIRKIPPATTWIPRGNEPLQQCAAVITQFSLRTDPPQNRLLLLSEDLNCTCHGNSPSSASSPPTIVSWGARYFGNTNIFPIKIN